MVGDWKLSSCWNGNGNIYLNNTGASATYLTFWNIHTLQLHYLL
jgi:hypothetical protein